MGLVWKIHNPQIDLTAGVTVKACSLPPSLLSNGPVLPAHTEMNYSIAANKSLEIPCRVSSTHMGGAAGYFGPSVLVLIIGVEAVCMLGVVTHLFQDIKKCK